MSNPNTSGSYVGCGFFGVAWQAVLGALLWFSPTHGLCEWLLVGLGVSPNPSYHMQPLLVLL